VIRPIDRTKVIEAIDAATAAGQEIVVIARASAAEMTSQEAAGFLRVSRPHITKLADQGVVPSRMVGTHRRFRLDDLVRYDETTRSVRHNALDQLFAESDEYQTGDV
jgi:excisionase family DNA binding protein